MKEEHADLGIKKKKISEEDVVQFVLERFNDVKKAKKIQTLIKFQSMNKYMLMSHDQEELKNLGNMVASYKKICLLDILDYYDLHLKKALKNPPTLKKHSNVILHIFGYFSRDFNVLEREIFFELLEKFRKERISIGEILVKINPLIYRVNNMYLASQTYFLLYSNSPPEIFSSM